MPEKVNKIPRVFLDHAHLRGFKSIENLKIDFQRGLNILIGKNGAGKSNLLEAINLAFRFGRTPKLQLRYSQLGFIAEDKHSFLIEYELALHPKSNKENFIDRPTLIERFYIDNELAFDSAEETDGKKMFKFKSKPLQYISIWAGLFQVLGYRHIYPFYIKYSLPTGLAGIDVPATLRANFEDNEYYWSIPDTTDFMESVLIKMDQSFFYKYPDKKNDITGAEVFQWLTLPQEILENLKAYTPIEDVKFNSNINVYHEDKALILENIKLDFKVNGNWLPWSQLSDGTKRLFYIVAEVTYTNGLVLIEEPELGIHPHQFNLLMDFLKEQSEEKQIIVSTHAPKALDHLSPEELNSILIAIYEPNEGTQIRHLTEKETKKGQQYMKEVGFFSDYWMLSDIEEW